MGTVEDFTNFINAVIDEKALINCKYIELPGKDANANIIVGGKCDKAMVILLSQR